MHLDYKIAESKERPLEIDITSSNAGVYVRRNIKELTRGEEDGEKYFQYQEAFISKSEYEQFSKDLLVGQINDENNSAEFEAYKNKLNTGVQYTNGHFYKPKYIGDYKRIMDDVKTAVDLINLLGGDPSAILSQQFAIFDETGKAENMVLMTGLEVINLYFFLYGKKEQYFAEYKASLEN